MSTTQNNPLASRLSELMEAMHWSRTDMAKIAGVSPTSVTNWFKRGTISKASAVRLAQAAKVSFSWVLTGEEERAGSVITEDELALLEVFRELPPIEQRNMLAAFQMRLKQLKDFYTAHVDPSTRLK